MGRVQDAIATSLDSNYPEAEPSRELTDDLADTPDFLPETRACPGLGELQIARRCHAW